MFRHLAFRSRLLLILALSALVPAAAISAVWAIAVGTALPLFSENVAWERVASTGTRLIDSLRAARLSEGQRATLTAHEQELGQSLTQARRFRFLARRSVPVIVVSALAAIALLGLAVSRVAGHLSRQLSRPLNELVRWTALIGQGDELPPDAPLRGAPEFGVLRDHMRSMATQLAAGRERAIEAERLQAFRESARRFAHELKNPLTPMQFAIARLDSDAPPELRDLVEVLRTETGRLDRMSRAFAQFGRMDDGPPSEVDVGELVRYTARAAVPPDVAVQVDVPAEIPTLHAQHDLLQRAVSNVLLNAADACGAGGRIHVTIELARLRGSDAVAIRVHDSGPGIPPERIGSIWEPYVTSKPGGTGLGLAIARQAVLAHQGEVEARSQAGAGATISLILPVGRMGAPTPSGPATLP